MQPTSPMCVSASENGAQAPKTARKRGTRGKRKNQIAYAPHSRQCDFMCAQAGECGKAGRRLLTRPKWNYEARGRLSRLRPRKNSGEGLDCGGFVVFDVENGVELGDLEQVVNFFCQFSSFNSPP